MIRLGLARPAVVGRDRLILSRHPESARAATVTSMRMGADLEQEGTEAIAPSDGPTEQVARQDRFEPAPPLEREHYRPRLMVHRPRSGTPDIAHPCSRREPRLSRTGRRQTMLLETLAAAVPACGQSARLASCGPTDLRGSSAAAGLSDGLCKWS
jgi:hypothetical protein